jgi:hypothetical protein
MEEWSEKVHLQRHRNAAPCFLCGNPAFQSLTPTSTHGDYAPAHFACAARVLILYEEWRRTGTLPTALIGASGRSLPAPRALLRP